LVILGAVTGSHETLAWSDNTRVRIVDQAVRLAPPSLGRLIRRHIEAAREGATAGFDREMGPTHALTPSGKGKADDELWRLVREAITGIEQREPMRVFCQRLGRISHVIADLNHPFHTGGLDLRSDAPYSDFSAYMEDVAERVPLVFYGWQDDLLGAKNLKPFARQIAQRSSRDTEPLKRAYYPNGTLVSSSTFDDRSIPFAVASLGYSRSVSDTANAWFYVWSQVGGDLRGTPYLDLPLEHQGE
jgi:hypothetical protein